MRQVMRQKIKTILCILICSLMFFACNNKEAKQESEIYPIAVRSITGRTMDGDSIRMYGGKFRYKGWYKTKSITPLRDCQIEQCDVVFENGTVGKLYGGKVIINYTHWEHSFLSAEVIDGTLVIQPTK